MTYAIVFITVYLLLMIGVGWWGLRKTRTLNDFFLGNRAIGPWVSALAYGTSYFSAVLFIGFAGKLGWGFGLKSLWIAVGNAFIGSLAAWLILGSRTRVMTQRLNVMTMPEFFHARYESPGLKIFAALLIFIFLLPYSASVYKGLGHLFEVQFHIPYEWAILAMTAVTGVYLILGGYFAITLTDFIQGIIMLGGAAAMTVVLLNQAGGPIPAWEAAAANYARHIPPENQPPTYLLVSLVLMTSFGVWGLPQMVQKFYSIKDARQIGRAAVVTTVFALLIGGCAYLTGSLSHVFVDRLPEGPNPFDRLIPDLLSRQLPAGLMALILLLVLSASMSTLSSLILVSSSAIAIDLYKGYLAPAASNRRSLAFMRFLSGIFVVLSFFIARQENAVIVTLMSLSWGSVAGAFLAPYLYGLYWRRGTASAAWICMAVAVGLANILFLWWGERLVPVASVTAMAVPLLLFPLISVYTRPPSQAALRRAFQEESPEESEAVLDDPAGLAEITAAK